MSLIDQLAEERIREAMARGEFDNLPGAGKPLELDDDSMVPPELRAGYRLLKNAGYLPPEAAALAELREAEQLVRLATDLETRTGAARRLDLLRARLGERYAAVLDREADYRERVLSALGDGQGGAGD